MIIRGLFTMVAFCVILMLMPVLLPFMIVGAMIGAFL